MGRDMSRLVEGFRWVLFSGVVENVDTSNLLNNGVDRMFSNDDIRSGYICPPDLC